MGEKKSHKPLGERKKNLIIIGDTLQPEERNRKINLSTTGEDQRN